MYNINYRFLIDALYQTEKVLSYSQLASLLLKKKKELNSVTLSDIPLFI